MESSASTLRTPESGAESALRSAPAKIGVLEKDSAPAPSFKGVRSGRNQALRSGKVGAERSVEALVESRHYQPYAIEIGKIVEFLTIKYQLN